MSSRGQKRRKIGLACVECRERKRKCDGERPACGNCAKRNPQPECIYTDESLKRGSSGYVESLRSRIRELEEQVQAQNAASSSAPGIADAGKSLSLRPDISSRLSDQASIPLTLGNVPNPAPLPAQSSIVSWTESSRVPPPPSSYPSLNRGESSASGSSPRDDELYLGIGPMGLPGGAQCHHCRGRRVHNTEVPNASSTTAFDYQVQEWATGRTGAESGVSPAAKIRSAKVCRCWAGRRMNVTRAVAHWPLPDRAQADALVDNYFEWVYGLYPYIVRPVFMYHYAQFWQPVKPEQHIEPSPSAAADTNVFFCQLNAIFALGSQFSSGQDAKWKASMGEMYYHRVLQALSFNLMERGSIEIVQTLLLTAQYLQATELWEMCWNFTGLAIRVAQAIGLHVPPPASEKGSRQPSYVFEEGMRRRTWAGCVALDRALSLLYGKPQMLHPSLTRSFIHNLPYRSDEAIMAAQDVNFQRPHQIEFFTHTLKMGHYLGDIIDLHYAQNPSGDTEGELERLSIDGPRPSMGHEHLQKMLRLDALLLKLNNEIPSHLELDVVTPGTLFGRQAHVLRVRHLHMRVYLLRPVLIDLYRYSINHGIKSEYSIGVSTAHIQTLTTTAGICLDSAMAVVDCIYNDEFGLKPPSNLWWYGIYYAYFCGTVLHAGRLCAERDPELQDESQMRESFQRCLQILKKYETQGASARTCRKALEMLERRAFPKHTSVATAVNAPTWSSDVAGSSGMESTYDPYQQYVSQPDYSHMFGGMFGSSAGATEPSSQAATDADHYFWSTFLPENRNP